MARRRDPESTPERKFATSMRIDRESQDYAKREAAEGPGGWGRVWYGDEATDKRIIEDRPKSPTSRFGYELKSRYNDYTGNPIIGKYAYESKGRKVRLPKRGTKR